MDKKKIIVIGGGFTSIIFNLLIPISKTLSTNFYGNKEEYRKNLTVNISNQTYPDRGDEIGKLSTNFKEMSKELLDRINELERITADLSHELKNPLASIKSAIEILQKGKENVKINNKLISIIDKDISRMNKLISDFAYYTKTKKEIEILESKKISINYLLEDIAASYKDNDKKISINIEFFKENYLVFANYDKLAQVISNVLNNAVSFSPNQSSILISCVYENKYCLIYIVDQGKGIDYKYRNKIFERFYTDRINNNNIHSGLGLDIARHIIESFNGKIRLEDKKIKGYNGACFVIELPLKEI